MLTNVASTSIDAHQALSNHGITSQYDKIINALKTMPDGTTRKRLALYLGMEPGTVAARVNELVSANRLTDGPDTRLIPQISRVRSKVVRVKG